VLIAEADGLVRGSRCAFSYSRAVAGAFVTCLVATMPVLAGGDTEAGKNVFKKFALCHTAEPGKNKIGPSLFGILGRHPANVQNFAYSQAMKDLDHDWDEKTLDTYLSDPKTMVPGTKMVFPGLKEQKDRDDVIAYLTTLK